MKVNPTIEDLKKLVDTTEDVKIVVNLQKWSLSETTEHYGEWNGKNFQMTATCDWKRASLECGMTLEDLIESIEECDGLLSNMSSGNFYDLACNEMSDGDISINRVEWEQELTEEEEDDIDLNDLYWDSEINECDYDFEPGSVWSISVKVGTEEFEIDDNDLVEIPL